MSTDKIDPNKNATELPPTEATPKDSKTELTEEELKKVSGGAIYMDYGGVKGEVTTSGHKDWIEI